MFTIPRHGVWTVLGAVSEPVLKVNNPGQRYCSPTLTLYFPHVSYDTVTAKSHSSKNVGSSNYRTNNLCLRRLLKALCDDEMWPLVDFVCTFVRVCVCLQLSLALVCVDLINTHGVSVTSWKLPCKAA